MKSELLALFVLTACIGQTRAEAQSFVRVRSGYELAIALNYSGDAEKFRIESVTSPHGYTLARSANRSGIAVLGSSRIKISDSRHRSRLVKRSKLEQSCRLFRRKNPSYLCEPNVLFHASTTPADTYYSRLYGLTKIGAEDAWGITTGSAAVKVAVVDSGVDYTHPDLSANIATNSSEVPDNGLDDDENGYIDDYYGYDFADLDGTPLDLNEHGTHVSGTIGAVGNNDRGVVGLNWTVGIVPVRVLDASGAGTLADVASGIDYAVARGVVAVNLSLGGSSSSALLRRSVSRALRANVLIVAAAGNEGENNDRVSSYPANYALDNVISVAASDELDNLAIFSNYGRKRVDLAAPGVDILSTVPEGKYRYLDGTSMATPHVAGAIALIKSANSALGALDLKSIILASVDKKRTLKGSCLTSGRLNVFSALQLAAVSTPQPTPDPGTDDPSLVGAAIYLQRKAATKKSVDLFGYVYNSDTVQGLENVNLYLICASNVVAHTSSSATGSFDFGRINRPSAVVKSKSCYVTTSHDEIISNEINIKAAS